MEYSDNLYHGDCWIMRDGEKKLISRMTNQELLETYKSNRDESLAQEMLIRLFQQSMITKKTR